MGNSDKASAKNYGSRWVKAERDERVLRALRSGPLYRPTLELILGLSEAQSRESLERLLTAGKVEIARDIGPATYRLVEARRGAA